MSDIFDKITLQYLNEFNEEVRPADLEIRKKLDMGFTWEKNKAVLFEIRPLWNDESQIVHGEFAKISYVKSSNTWKLYWMRASGKWELYEPHPTGSSIHELLDVVKEDAYSCFFG